LSAPSVGRITAVIAPGAGRTCKRPPAPASPSTASITGAAPGSRLARNITPALLAGSLP
jgi:hypothetical protein